VSASNTRSRLPTPAHHFTHGTWSILLSKQHGDRKGGDLSSGSIRLQASEQITASRNTCQHQLPVIAAAGLQLEELQSCDIPYVAPHRGPPQSWAITLRWSSGRAHSKPDRKPHNRQSAKCMPPQRMHLVPVCTEQIQALQQQTSRAQLEKRLLVV